ncbi:transglycosylase domain-containing protein [Streptomyces sp. NPDC088745]|uniref:transglycosylase domain-containing protein n=1 Tax=Streptomyces sp. NPDC088745 TaxID=3365884 RepID=UPI00381E4C0E
MGRADERRARQSGGSRRAAGAPGKSGIRRLFTWKKVLGTFFGLCLLAMGAFVALYMAIDIPEGNASARTQSNVYKYSDGKTVIARTGSGEYARENVSLDKIPKKVQTTFVAAENMSFYDDHGIDFKGTARGLLNTFSGKGKQGGSTITQQYVKNYYLTPEQTVTRKLKELVISLKVDQKYEKDDILLGYINTSYYGRGAAGIQAAAQAYYRKDADKLTVEEGAYLAALLQAPSSYDVLNATPTNKRLVMERWNYVLDNMVEMGALQKAERAAMTFPMPKPVQPNRGMKGQAGYLIEAAEQQLKVREGLTEKELAAGGWTITLNIDKDRQKALEKAVDRQLESKLDRRSKKKVDRNVQAGGTSVDPKTGAVVALYGGADYLKHQISNATRTDYQPASTFKPAVFAAALEQGSVNQDGEKITANTIYSGKSRRPVVGEGGGGYAPQNEDDKSYGDIDVQEATDKSVNSVFAQMIVDVGAKHVKQTALKLGMQDRGDFGASPAMALGTMKANTMDMAAMYASLAAHGKKVVPSIVKTAEHKDRTIEPKGFAADGQGISRQAADTVTSVLEHVVQEGTGRAVSSGKYHAAGKTGTSENNRSAWFAGYTPELATAIGIFGEDADKPRQTTLTGAAGGGRMNGSSFPARIWADYTLGALDGGSDAKFDLEIKDGAAWEPPPPPPPPETKPPETKAPEKPEEPEEPEHKPDPGKNQGQDQGQANQGKDQGQNQGGDHQGQNQGQNQGQANQGQNQGGDHQGQNQGQNQGGQNQGGDNQGGGDHQGQDQGQANQGQNQGGDHQGQANGGANDGQW